MSDYTVKTPDEKERERCTREIALSYAGQHAAHTCANEAGEILKRAELYRRFLNGEESSV